MPKLRVEYAKSGRSKCNLKECGKCIAKDEVRIGSEVMLPMLTDKGDDAPKSYKWRHLCCFTSQQLKNARDSGDLDNIEGYHDLAPVDQKFVDDMKLGNLVKSYEVIGRLGDVANLGRASTTASVPKKPSPKKKTDDVSDDKDGTEKSKPKRASRAKAFPAKIAKPPLNSDSDTTAEYEVAVQMVGSKPLCPYGSDCFRTSDDHFAEYAHGPSSESTAQAAPEPVILGIKHPRVSDKLVDE